MCIRKKKLSKEESIGFRQIAYREATSHSVAIHWEIKEGLNAWWSIGISLGDMIVAFVPLKQ